MTNLSINTPVTFRGKPAVIKANARGWLTLEDNNGVSHKARPSDPGLKLDPEALTPRKEPKKATEGKVRAARKIGQSVVRNFQSYQKHKTATGNTSYDMGDPLAVKLRGMELDEIYKEAAKVLNCTQKELHDKYDKLNVGMQRMNLGNRMRAAAKKAAAAN